MKDLSVYENMTEDDEAKIFEMKTDMKLYDYAQGLFTIQSTCFGCVTAASAFASMYNSDIRGIAGASSLVTAGMIGTTIYSHHMYKVQKAKLSKDYKEIGNRKKSKIRK